MSEPQRPYLADGTELDEEELQATAKALLDESDLTQQQLAERLDLSRGVIAKALTVDKGYTRVQRLVIEELGGADHVKEEVRYRIVKEGEDDA